MAKPIKLKNRTPLVTNVSRVYRDHITELAKRITKESGKVITVSEMMRIAIEKMFPLINYEYLYPKKEENKNQMEFFNGSNTASDS